MSQLASALPDQLLIRILQASSSAIAQMRNTENQRLVVDMALLGLFVDTSVDSSDVRFVNRKPESGYVDKADVGGRALLPKLQRAPVALVKHCLQMMAQFKVGNSPQGMGQTMQ